MTCFPDINVWTALDAAVHVHRRKVIDWHEDSSRDAMVFSRVTQMGFLRLLTSPHVMGKRVATIAEAWGTFDGSFRNEGILFATEPPGLELIWRDIKPAPGTGHAFWTDAYLAAFAQTTDFTLITFDRVSRSTERLP